MNKEERQKKIDSMSYSCTQEDKDYCKSQVDEWCKECDKYYNYKYTIKILKALGKKMFFAVATSNVKCNAKLRNNTLTKEDFIHNQTLKNIFIRLCKAEAKARKGKKVKSIIPSNNKPGFYKECKKYYIEQHLHTKWNLSFRQCVKKHLFF